MDSISRPGRRGEDYFEDRNGDGRYEFMVEYRNGRQIRYLDRNLDNFYDAHEVVP